MSQDDNINDDPSEVARSLGYYLEAPRHLTEGAFRQLLLDLGIIDRSRYQDPFPGKSIVDLQAFALDPDIAIRLAAAASRWNWDIRLQALLATDPDERVVLALLDNVDPDPDICKDIIDGPHVQARRVLAGRNLITRLLELLQRDSDDLAAATATRVLDARNNGYRLPTRVAQ